MASIALCHASAIQITPRSVTHGRESVFANRDSRAPIAIGRAPPTPLAKIACRCAPAKTMPTASQRMVPVFVVQAGWVSCATSSATRGNMARTVSMSAGVRMAPHAIPSLVSANAHLAGRAFSATRSVQRANMVQTVQRFVTATMEPLATISQACAPVHLVMLGLPVTGRVQRDTLAVGVSTNATVSTPTLTGATTRQDGVCAGRAGRVSDATRIAPRVGGERAVQRSASVTRAPATN